MKIRSQKLQCTNYSQGDAHVRLTEAVKCAEELKTLSMNGEAALKDVEHKIVQYATDMDDHGFGLNMKNMMWLTQRGLLPMECRGSRPHTDGWLASSAVIQSLPKGGLKPSSV